LQDKHLAKNSAAAAKLPAITRLSEGREGVARRVVHLRPDHSSPIGLDDLTWSLAEDITASAVAFLFPVTPGVTPKRGGQIAFGLRSLKYMDYLSKHKPLFRCVTISGSICDVS